MDIVAEPPHDPRLLHALSPPQSWCELEAVLMKLPRPHSCLAIAAVRLFA